MASSAAESCHCMKSFIVFKMTLPPYYCLEWNIFWLSRIMRLFPSYRSSELPLLSLRFRGSCFINVNLEPNIYSACRAPSVPGINISTSVGTFVPPGVPSGNCFPPLCRIFLAAFTSRSISRPQRGHL